MPLYMYQAAYTAESLAAQLKNPQNRADTVGRAACEAVGGKLVRTARWRSSRPRRPLAPLDAGNPESIGQARSVSPQRTSSELL